MTRHSLANRRGQGLSVNMLIIIAIGLVVLVISILMFTRTSGKANDSLNSCGYTAKCYDATAGQTCQDIDKNPAFGKCTAPKICCQMSQTELDAREAAQQQTAGTPAKTP